MAHLAVPGTEATEYLLREDLPQYTERTNRKWELDQHSSGFASILLGNHVMSYVPSLRFVTGDQTLRNVTCPFRHFYLDRGSSD